MTTTPTKNDSMDGVFAALAHPVRRQVLDIVKSTPGVMVGAVCEHFPISRIAVLKHINQLERAELLISERDGRARRLYFNIVPIQLIYDRWTSDYSSLWAARLTHMKHDIESRRPSDE